TLRFNIKTTSIPHKILNILFFINIIGVKNE
ncbi:unnamed protein product, partial [marine sediment metagenome]